MKYHYAGKEKKLSFGAHPTITLAEAHKRRGEAKKIHADGRGPGKVKEAENLEKDLSEGRALTAIATEWCSAKVSGWSASYADYVNRVFKNNVFPYIGGKPISDIEPLELLTILQYIEGRGACELANEVHQRCDEVFRYAVVTGRARYNPASDLIIAMKSHRQAHYPFPFPPELPEFLYKLESYTGSVVTREATKLLMFTELRTVELRMREWCEIDFSQKIWEVPPTRIKVRGEHTVPLSNQTIRSFQILKELTGRYRYTFTGRNDVNRPISDANVNMVLKEIGYDEKATGHGFRHTMSTTLHEKGFNSAWIEMQLTHTDKSSIHGTYNHARYLEERREMMQWHTDYPDATRKDSPAI